MESLKATDSQSGRPEYVTIRLPDAIKPALRLPNDVKTALQIMPDQLEDDASHRESSDVESTVSKLLSAFFRHISAYAELAQGTYLRCRNHLSPGFVLVNNPPAPKPDHVAIARVFYFVEFCIGRIWNNTLVRLHILKNEQSL